MKYRYLLTLLLILNSCLEHTPSGELGGWNNVVFKTPEVKLREAIDSLYKAYPTYKHIKKWNFEAESWVKNYNSLRTTIFYFEERPEEMYYVTFVDAGTGENPNYSRLAIRGVENGKGSWKRYVDLNHTEQIRITARFNDEIVKPLENILGTESYVD